MIYPTPAEIDAADREQICRWVRFLPSASNEEEASIVTRIMVRYDDLGGFTPELSKKIGWDHE